MSKTNRDQDFAKKDKEQRERYKLGVACKTAMVMIENKNLHTALEVLRCAVRDTDLQLGKK